MARLRVYVNHGVSFHVALYKRQPDEAQIIGWFNQFFDSLEETKLKPYLL